MKPSIFFFFTLLILASEARPIRLPSSPSPSSSPSWLPQFPWLNKSPSPPTPSPFIPDLSKPCLDATRRFTRPCIVELSSFNKNLTNSITSNCCQFLTNMETSCHDFHSYTLHKRPFDYCTKNKAHLPAATTPAAQPRSLPPAVQDKIRCVQVTSRLGPCTSEIVGFDWNLTTSISVNCCNVIKEVDSDCSGFQLFSWSKRPWDYCTKN